MVTISHITHKLIEDNFIFLETVGIGIVNFTSLAKLLKSDVEKIYRKKVKLSSITRAIQRYAEKVEKKQKKYIFNYFKAIKLDSDVIYIAVHESPKVLEKIRRVYDEIDFNECPVFNILQGTHEIAIITNKEYKDSLLDILSDEKITHVLEDHDSITLLHSKDYSFTPGVIYNISRQIAWENINVLSWLHTPTELTLIIHEDDAMKCYNILHKMQKEQKNENFQILNVVK